MNLKASDLAKLTAAIAAGSVTQEAVTRALDSGDHSFINSVLGMGAGVVTGSIVGDAMDATGASDLIDDAAESIGDVFGF